MKDEDNVIYRATLAAMRELCAKFDAGMVQAQVLDTLKDVAANVRSELADLRRGVITEFHDSFGTVEEQMMRPSVLYRPSISQDGTDWCALYGTNLQDGISGHGATVEEAMLDFDKAWCNTKTQKAITKAQGE